MEVSEDMQSTSRIAQCLSNVSILDPQLTENTTATLCMKEVEEVLARMLLFRKAKIMVVKGEASYGSNLTR